MEYMLSRFGHLSETSIVERFHTQRVWGQDGSPLNPESPLEDHPLIWYYRSLPQEDFIPGQVQILHQDRELLVVDKPHFLPTTPGGRYVQQTALVRLRRLLDAPELAPIHRLDRLTAGVLMFSFNPATRGAYQQLFERRRVHKTYEALAPLGALPLPELISNRLVKTRGTLRTQVVQGDPNAHTRVSVHHDWEAVGGRLAFYQLEPLTGKTHQLRVQMAQVGRGILYDPFYPALLDEREDDFSRPLQLLAREVSFTDPLTGNKRMFRSSLKLNEAPRGGGWQNKTPR